MDKFRKYLKSTRDYLINVLQIFGDVPGTESKSLVRTVKSNLELLDDIIHHFDLFVKDEIKEKQKTDE